MSPKQLRYIDNESQIALRHIPSVSRELSKMSFRKKDDRFQWENFKWSLDWIWAISLCLSLPGTPSCIKKASLLLIPFVLKVFGLAYVLYKDTRIERLFCCHRL